MSERNDFSRIQSPLWVFGDEKECFKPREAPLAHGAPGIAIGQQGCEQHTWQRIGLRLIGIDVSADGRGNGAMATPKAPWRRRQIKDTNSPVVRLPENDMW